MTVDLLRGADGRRKEMVPSDVRRTEVDPVAAFLADRQRTTALDVMNTIQ